MEWVALARAEDPKDLVAELTADTLVGRFSGLDIHILQGWEKPACMREIGRIREQEFRAVGAGRNVPFDVDHLDLTQGSYRQLIAWDPVNRELVSMYRFADTRQILRAFGIQGLRTHTLFTMSPAFQKRYLDRALELGRSVVNRRARRSIAGLYAVWSGLGILHRELPHVAYFFGNVTLPADLPRTCLDALVHFLQSRYSSPQLRAMLAARPGMAYPLSLPPPNNPPQTLADLRTLFTHHDARLPAILVSYLNATEDLHVFDTARDEDFGNAWETALAIPTAAITPKSRQRFVDGYARQAGGYFDQPRPDRLGRPGADCRGQCLPTGHGTEHQLSRCEQRRRERGRAPTISAPGFPGMTKGPSQGLQLPSPLVSRYVMNPGDPR